jgi:hypothetical protein
MPIGAIISGGASLLGGIIGGIGSESAASTAAKGAQQAGQEISSGLQQGQQALTNAGADVTQNLSPYNTLGLGATTQLGNLLTATPGATSGGYQTGTGGLLEGWNQEFQAPTTASLNDPNNPLSQQFQFITQQGDQALNNAAAARGDLFSTATSKALANYNQGAASQYSQQQYNNALQQYQQAYGQFQQNQSNTFNRLQAVSGQGQQAATAQSQLQAGLGGQSANLALGGAQAIGQTIQSGANASAQGTVGLTNSLSNGFSNAGQTAMLSQLLQNQNASSYNPSSFSPGMQTQIPLGFNPGAGAYLNDNGVPS